MVHFPQNVTDKVFCPQKILYRIKDVKKMFNLKYAYIMNNN